MRKFSATLHHAAGTDSKMARAGGDLRDQNFRAGAGKTAARMMLAYPVITHTHYM